MVSDVSLMQSMLRWLTHDASCYYCVFVVGCDGLVAGATTAALSNRGELLGAMQMGRLLTRRGMSPVSAFCLGCSIHRGFQLYGTTPLHGGFTFGGQQQA
eukprot:scaffold257388_cov156-Cyclotella_meneghiniana.AAC.1